MFRRSLHRVVWAGRPWRGPALMAAVWAGIVFGGLDGARAGAVSSQPEDPGIETTLSTEIDAERRRLELEKLRQEVRRLRIENDRGGFWGFVGSNAGALTALVALLGAGITILKQISEQNRQRDLDRAEREKDRLQREDALNKESQTRFAAVLSDLGSEREAVKAAAATTLLTFLRPEHESFHRQVRMAALVNLKVEHTEVIYKLLRLILEKALRTDVPLDTFDLDLSRAWLRGADLSGLKLDEADLAHAQLQNASLCNTKLFRARGIGVHLDGARLSGPETDLREVRFKDATGVNTHFHDAYLVKGHFKEAVLTGAEFQRAHLQSAHLEGAQLQGARFERADLNDTYFKGAELDDAALRSITRAENWRKAHFDEATGLRLNQIAGGST